MSKQPGRKASLSLPQTYRSSIIYSNGNLGLYYHIFATGALYGSGTISSPITGISITEALDGAGALLVRAILAFGSGSGSSGSGSGSSTVLLRFRPRFTLSAVASSASSVALLHFRPRLPLPLASLAASFTICFARASLRSL
ncbi:hypothetical protein F5882DRAFT_401031 [Hyaloscypha sp. PMI_1271]|nr:hypothetical protein F5882DRAFT_401031 [Hyaloscypha sp. PMI_1271]